MQTNHRPAAHSPPLVRRRHLPATSGQRPARRPRRTSAAAARISAPYGRLCVKVRLSVLALQSEVFAASPGRFHRAAPGPWFHWLAGAPRPEPGYVTGPSPHGVAPSGPRLVARQVSPPGWGQDWKRKKKIDENVRICREARRGCVLPCQRQPTDRGESQTPF